MKILLTLPPGTEATAVTDSTGRVTGIEITPFFHGRRASSTFALGEARTSSNKVVDSFSLLTSGVTGAVTINRRVYESAVPYIEAPNAEDDGEDGDNNEQGDPAKDQHEPTTPPKPIP